MKYTYSFYTIIPNSKKPFQREVDIQANSRDDANKEVAKEVNKLIDSFNSEHPFIKEELFGKIELVDEGA